MLNVAKSEWPPNFVDWKGSESVQGITTSVLLMSAYEGVDSPIGVGELISEDCVQHLFRAPVVGADRRRWLGLAPKLRR
jgi:hypothetical protein